MALAKNKGVCFRCLRGGHIGRQCKRKDICDLDGCKSLHHRLLHGAPRMSQDERSTKNNGSGSTPSSEQRSAAPIVNAVSSNRDNGRTLLYVTPVRLKSEGVYLDTFALFDPGSEVTLIRSDAAGQLGLRGDSVSLQLGTYHGQDPEVDAKRVSFFIESTDRSTSIEIPRALSVPRLNSSRWYINWPEQKRKWSHLADLDLPEVDSSQVTVLVGSDVARAHKQLDWREPPPGVLAPTAMLTRFGWSVVGHYPLWTPESRPSLCNLIRREPSPELQDLHGMVEKFWTTEALGVSAKDTPASPEDTKALKIFEGSLRHDGDRFEIGLPWKSPDITLPDNRNSALRRLFAMERRFARDPEFARRYEAIIAEYVSLGHARPLNPDELEGPKGRTWFLPHHGVVNLNKPDKVRVVFDASAKHDGVSLNCCLLRGPDFIVSLPGLLIRFREGLVAVSSDVEKMFHQVKVKPEDQTALRFLWRPPGDASAPRTYQMTVQIFGSVSSPSICMFALRKTAEVFSPDRPDLIEKIKRNMYVDNLLDSTDTEDQAITICKELSDLLRRGGFKLTKWLSSSRRVMEFLPIVERLDPKLDLDLDELPVERTLGMLWNAEMDPLSFRITVPERTFTKRNVLKTVASIFDPLGFLSPVILVAKCLPPGLAKTWTSWLSELDCLHCLSIGRCFRRDATSISSVQLHTFSDASEIGYGAVSYLRLLYSSGEPSVTFVMSKSRVTPLKQLTIPRLELLGALVAARLSRTVLKELKISVQESYLWTDSTTVLRWLRSRNRLTTFVANRVGEILELTNSAQWHHVPGDQNPADECSRGLMARDFMDRGRWFGGPEFLAAPQITWPKCGTLEDDLIDDPEIVLAKLAGLIEEPLKGIDDLFYRSSNVAQIKRIVAYVLRFTRNSQLKPEGRKGGSLDATEMKQAVVLCLKVAQIYLFADELKVLKDGKPVKVSSRLSKLNPYIDHDGLIRADGRIKHAHVDPDTRNPVILCPEHPLTGLIIRDLYERLLHASTERTLCEIQQTYWVLRGRATVQRLIRRCVPCRKVRSQPQPPLMAALPVDRLKSSAPAFTNTGIDFFGPLQVIIHRRVHKRYGCLFTCLVTRAIHIEIAESLDVDSFLMALRRFIGRRGCPVICYSDNGTNLVAGERILREGLQNLKSDKLLKDVAERGIVWKFSPPAAPHFGGAWERMVRSAKITLRATLKNRTVTDEVLATVMVEVEALINSRPLTHVSLDHRDMQPLTPNHLLLGRANPNIPPDIFCEEEVNSRKRWRASQAIANLFWRRWLREYVPNLIERRTWLKARRNLRPGDVVLVVDNNSPRGRWPLGRVTKAIPGPDGAVRTAAIKTVSGEYVRPVAKLCLLEESEDVTAEDPSI